MLQSTKKGFLSIVDYVLKIQNHAESLVVTGQGIPNKGLIFYSLGDLGLENKSIVANLTSCSDF